MDYSALVDLIKKNMLQQKSKLTVYYTIRNVDPHFKARNLDEALRRIKRIERQLSLSERLENVYCVDFNTLKCWEYTSKEANQRFVKSSVECMFHTYWNEFSKKEFEKIAKRLKTRWNSLEWNQAYNLIPETVDKLDKIGFWQSFKFAPFLCYGKLRG